MWPRRDGRFDYGKDRSSRSVAGVLMDHFGPIRDTMKSTVAATGMEKMNKVKRIHNSWRRFRSGGAKKVIFF